MLIAGYKLSNHAKKRLALRVEIETTWIAQALESPLMVKNISEYEAHYYKDIPQYGGRVLKVLVNPSAKLIITVFFDRRIRKHEDRL